MSSLAILATSSKLLFGYCYDVFIEIIITAVVSKKSCLCEVDIQAMERKILQGKFYTYLQT